MPTQLQKADVARSVLKRKTGRHRVVIGGVVGNGVARVDVHEAVRDGEGTAWIGHRAGLRAGAVAQTSTQIVSQTPGKQSVDAGSEAVTVTLRAAEWPALRVNTAGSPCVIMFAGKGKARVITRIRNTERVARDLRTVPLDLHIEIVLQRGLQTILERQTLRHGVGCLRARRGGGDTKPGQNISQGSHVGWR